MQMPRCPAFLLAYAYHQFGDCEICHWGETILMVIRIVVTTYDQPGPVSLHILNLVFLAFQDEFRVHSILIIGTVNYVSKIHLF